MATSRAYLDYVLGQLGGLERLRSRRMFGAAGLYSGELFFGIVSEDTLYLRADAASRPEFLAHGAQPFRPYAERPEVSMTYYAVPAAVLEDADELVRWSRRAVSAAQAVAAVRAGRPRKARRAPRPRRG